MVVYVVETLTLGKIDQKYNQNPLSTN